MKVRCDRRHYCSGSGWGINGRGVTDCRAAIGRASATVDRVRRGDFGNRELFFNRPIASAEQEPRSPALPSTKGCLAIVCCSYWHYVGELNPPRLKRQTHHRLLENWSQRRRGFLQHNPLKRGSRCSLGNLRLMGPEADRQQPERANSPAARGDVLTPNGEAFSALAMPSAPSPGRGHRVSRRAMPMPLASHLWPVRRRTRGAAR